MTGGRDRALGHGLVVRPARAADAEAIGRVYVETWRDAYAGMLPERALLGLRAERVAVSWRRAIAQRHDITRVAVVDGRLVAFGSAGRSRTPALPFAGEVFTLYVHPDHQAQGLGRRLLATLLATLNAEGLGSALVWVVAANPARHFYRAMGGRLVAHKTERLWGAEVAQEGFAWDDLARALRHGAPLSPRP